MEKLVTKSVTVGTLLNFLESIKIAIILGRLTQKVAYECTPYV